MGSAPKKINWVFSFFFLFIHVYHHTTTGRWNQTKKEQGLAFLLKR
jgi:hypothetical protein